MSENITLTEKVLCGMLEEHGDNEEIRFHQEMLYEHIKLFSAPEHSEYTIEGHFFDLICNLERAVELQAFQRGLAFAFRLMAENIVEAEKCKGDFIRKWKEECKEQIERAEKMRESKHSDLVSKKDVKSALVTALESGTGKKSESKNE